jgi:type IV pilus assembly protein PilA
MQDTINRLRDKKDDEGFTLIELLVVVVIIGVLVAIAVPVYLNYRQGAADKSAQSDVRGGVSALEQFYTNNGNQYPADIAATSGTNGKVALAALTGGTAGVITVSEGTTIQFDNVSVAAGYVLCGTNANGTGGKVYIYNSGPSGTGSVKASSQVTIALCISTAS